MNQVDSSCVAAGTGRTAISLCCKLSGALAPLALPALVFVLILFVHANCRVINSVDSAWSIYTAQSLISEGNLDLDEYREQVRHKRSWGVRKKKGHLYNFFPPGSSLIAVPFVWIFDSMPGPISTALLPGIEVSSEPGAYSDRPASLTHHLELERAIASFLVACVAVAIYLLGRDCLGQPGSALLALIFGFCTPAWSVASRGLWQHAPSMLLATSAILAIRAGDGRARWPLLAGALLGFAYIVRPTNSLTLLVMALYLALRRRREFPFLLIGSALPLAPFVAVNLSIYNTLLPPYFNAGRLTLSTAILEALAANLASASRGLFVLSPILLFALHGLAVRAKKAGLCELDLAVGAAMILHWGVVSSFKEWWGGHCYGARYMTDTLPYLFYFMRYSLADLAQNPARRLLLPALCAAAIYSAAVHYRGANSRITQSWNVAPRNIDDNPSRVWSLSDPQHLRGLGSSFKNPGVPETFRRSGQPARKPARARRAPRGDETGR